MTFILTALVIVLGLINIIRVCLLFILGELADLRRWYKDHIQKNKKKQRKYQPKVDILIAAHNEALTIERCLSSVSASTYPHFQIVVIDDGSNDETSAVVRKWQQKHNYKNLTLIRQHNQGKAHALNNALKKSKATLVMSLDADSVIDKQAIARSVAYFRGRQTMAVAANVRILFSPTFLGLTQVIEYLLGYRLKKAYSFLNNEYIIGGIGAMFRRSIIKKVKYYDTDTQTEDIDLTMKIVALGNKNHQVIYGDDVYCFTEPVSSISDLFRQRFRWKYGRMQTLMKHRHLFFNTNHQYTRGLTWFQLPFVIWSELVFLFDPLLLLFVIGIALIHQDIESFKGMFFFLGFYTSLTIAIEKDLSWTRKLQLLAVSPLAYFMFAAISVVEYAGLLKCLVHFRGVINPKLSGCSWHHVKRIGLAS